MHLTLLRGFHSKTKLSKCLMTYSLTLKQLKRKFISSVFSKTFFCNSSEKLSGDTPSNDFYDCWVMHLNTC